jgi:hypothetical protein
MGKQNSRKAKQHNMEARASITESDVLPFCFSAVLLSSTL